MSVRSEFDDAFDEALLKRCYPNGTGENEAIGLPWTENAKWSAEWAAKWMVERCAKEVSGYLGRDVEPQDKIRQLAKELSQ